MSVELDNPLHSGFNSISEAELGRDGFRLVFARVPALTAFPEPRAGLEWRFGRSGTSG